MKSRKLIEELFSKGNSFSHPPIRVTYLPAESGLQAGVGVSSRNFKKAVDRNRIKRQIREAYRLQKGPLRQLLSDGQKGLLLFFTCTSRELPEYNALAEAMWKSIGRLIKITNEKGSADT